MAADDPAGGPGPDVQQPAERITMPFRIAPFPCPHCGVDVLVNNGRAVLRDGAYDLTVGRTVDMDSVEDSGTKFLGVGRQELIAEVRRLRERAARPWWQRLLHGR